MLGRSESGGCICSARHASRVQQTKIGKARAQVSARCIAYMIFQLTAIDIKQIAHSEVCVDALSPSGLPLARFRSL